MAKKKNKKQHGKYSLGDPGEKRSTLGHIGHEAVKPVGVIGGFLLASGAGYLLDKIKFLAPEAPPADGTAAKFNVKSLIKPVVLTGVGAAGIYFTRKDNKPEGTIKSLARHVSYGFTGGGIYSIGKVFLKKDLTTGLGEVSDGTNQVKMLEETKKEIENLIASNTYKLNLPSTEQPGGTSGMGYLDPMLELQDMESAL